MNKTTSISSKDVAKAAGVSQATVSYVLNNVPGIKIKPETKAAVILAAKKLNYHPNLIARSMRLKKSMSIGIVSDKNVSNFMFMRVLEGIKDVLIPRNYSITLCFDKSPDIENAEHIKYFNSNRIDGIIFAFANVTEEHCSFLLTNNIPFVIIQANLSTETVNLVKTDMTNALQAAVTYLWRKDITQIAYLGDNAGNVTDRRFIGYQKALASFELPPDDQIWFKPPSNEEFLEKYFSETFWPLRSIPRAIICETNNLGFHLLRYAAKSGIKVPLDLAVIAIGTTKYSRMTYPALSTIESPLYEMGVTGCEMLFNNIQENLTNSVVVLEWAFVPRESC